jgi:carbonic anhydrase
VPLIVVLGHDSCGAVKATLSALDDERARVVHRWVQVAAYRAGGW